MIKRRLITLKYKLKKLKMKISGVKDDSETRGFICPVCGYRSENPLGDRNVYWVVPDKAPKGVLPYIHKGCKVHSRMIRIH